MENNLRNKLKDTKGITLVALIVTIIVLLILAAVSLSSVFNQDGIFSRAEKARTKHEIVQLKEALEIAKNPVLIDGVGYIDKEQYFDEIQRQELINDKTKDVVDNGDGTYDVTTKPGHVFLIELLPTKENPRDIKIDYIGEAGKILPIIRKLEVSATSTSITGKATVSRLGSGTIKYYYKVATEGDNTYKEITNVNAETGATQSNNIVAGIKYIIKVVAKNNVGEVSDTKEITATKISVESITLKDNEVVGKEKSVALTAIVKPDNATNKNLKWTSSNTAVAIVNENGEITGIEAGTTVITASVTDGSEKTASCAVTVKSVSLNKTSTTIEKGSSEKLIATVLPEDTVNKNVIWESSNTEIATVDSNGIVTGIKGGGPVTITASTTDNSKATATCYITVVIPVSQITISPSSALLKQGETIQLTAEILPSNATNKSVKWESSNENIATVDANGFVNKIGVGSVEIKAISEENSAKVGSCMIQGEILVESITLTKVSGTSGIGVNRDFRVIAEVFPENATNKEVRWEISSGSGFSVGQDGTLKWTLGTGSGTVTCYATDGSGVSASIKVSTSSTGGVIE